MIYLPIQIQCNCSPPGVVIITNVTPHLGWVVCGNEHLANYIPAMFVANSQENPCGEDNHWKMCIKIENAEIGNWKDLFFNGESSPRPDN